MKTKQKRQARRHVEQDRRGAYQGALFAFIHDGTFDGDSPYYFPSDPIPYTLGMTLDAIIEDHIQLLRDREIEYGGTILEADAWESDFREYDLPDVVGAVIVDKLTFKAMEAIWESEPDDSAAYSCNRAAKRIAWTLKKRFVGKEMV